MSSDNLVLFCSEF